MKSSESLKEFSSAFAKFQSEVSNPKNTATNPQYRSKYAPLEEVINATKPFLTKYGLSYIQSCDAEGEAISVTTRLLHESGEWLESDPLTLPAYQIKSGGKKEYNAQGAGSAISYARRYSLSAMLGISSEDDDDANGQTGNGGYKDASSNPEPTTTVTDDEREKRRLEAIERAKAKKEASNNTTTKEEDKPDNTSNGTGKPSNNTDNADVKLISASQQKAIANLLSIVEKKRKDSGFNKDDFMKEKLAEYEVSSVGEVTSDQGGDLIKAINALMKL